MRWWAFHGFWLGCPRSVAGSAVSAKLHPSVRRRRWRVWGGYVEVWDFFCSPGQGFSTLVVDQFSQPRFSLSLKRERKSRGVLLSEGLAGMFVGARMNAIFCRLSYAGLYCFG